MIEIPTRIYWIVVPISGFYHRIFYSYYLVPMQNGFYVFNTLN